MDINSDQRFLLDEEPDVLESFRNSFEEAITIVEELSLELESSPNDQYKIDKMGEEIKHLYSYAYNANIIPLIEPLITLDDFFQSLGGSYHAGITHPLTLLIDRLLLIANEASEQSSISMTLISDVQRAIQPLAKLKTGGNLDEIISQVVDILLGNYTTDSTSDSDIDLFDGPELFDEIELFDSPEAETQQTESSPESVNTSPESHENPEVDTADVVKLEMDILRSTSIHRTLGEYIDTRHKIWVGRSFFLLSLALKLNAEGGTKVKPEELANAIFLHDFPMVRLSDEILYAREFNEKMLQKTQKHTTHAKEMANLLNCGENVEDMVYQHHERPDGKGYPKGLTNEKICDGAKIIAICDAYYAMTNYKANRKVKRSALRTVAEINACSGTQFDETWVKVFNKVVKKYHMLQNI